MIDHEKCTPCVLESRIFWDFYLIFTLFHEEKFYVILLILFYLKLTQIVYLQDGHLGFECVRVVVSCLLRRCLVDCLEAKQLLLILFENNKNSYTLMANIFPVALSMPRHTLPNWPSPSTMSGNSWNCSQSIK